MQPKTVRMLRLFGVLLLVSVGAAILLWKFQSNLEFFYTPSQLVQKSVPQGKPIRVGGLVMEGSVVRQLGDGELHFVITDLQEEQPVRYRGVIPALFREGQGVVVRGMLQEGGVLVADELLAKHDETYMPPEVARALKAQGHWRQEKGEGLVPGP